MAGPPRTAFFYEPLGASLFAAIFSCATLCAEPVLVNQPEVPPLWLSPNPIKRHQPVEGRG